MGVGATAVDEHETTTIRFTPRDVVDAAAVDVDRVIFIGNRQSFAVPPGCLDGRSMGGRVFGIRHGVDASAGPSAGRAGPQIQSLVGGAIASNLGDPDGSGPADSRIAAAIQAALAGISVAGPVGDAVSATLDAPFTRINEKADGIAFQADSRFSTNIGTGAGQSQPVAGAPTLPATFVVPGSFPTLGATTPAGDPYGLGLVISASSFNQLLGSMAECGSLNPTVTEFSGVPITSSLLSLLVPAFSKLPANTPMKIVVTSTSVGVDCKAMIGADACCTTGDESISANAAYTVALDVLPENGDTWELDLNHFIKGAHTLIDERVALEDAGGETPFTTAVRGRVSTDNGATWQNSDFNPSVMSVTHKIRWRGKGEGTTNDAFTGENALALSGTVATHVIVEFDVGLYALSDSNLAAPAAGGDEVAIRFGANDTITNGFTAGGYPGLGDRSLVDDGWCSKIQLTASLPFRSVDASDR